MKEMIIEINEILKDQANSAAQTNKIFNEIAKAIENTSSEWKTCFHWETIWRQRRIK